MRNCSRREVLNSRRTVLRLRLLAICNLSLALVSWPHVSWGLLIKTSCLNNVAALANLLVGEWVNYIAERHARVALRRRPPRRTRISFGLRACSAGDTSEDRALVAKEALKFSRKFASCDNERSNETEVSAPRALPSARRGKSSATRNLMAQMAKAAGKRQHWKDAIAMFDRMQQEGVPPVKAAYVAALRACAKGAEWERSLKLLDNYLEEGFILDEGVVNAAIKACCRAGRPDEAGTVLATSLARGLIPDTSLFTAVMNACYTVGNMDAILSLGEELRRQRLKPDHAAYHLMVTSYISKSDWVRATEALVEMGQAGMMPSARSARQWRLASAAIEEIDIGSDDEWLDHRIPADSGSVAIGEGTSDPG